MSNGPTKTLEDVLRDSLSEKVAKEIYELILKLNDDEKMGPDQILAEITLHISDHIQRDLTEDIITKGGNPKVGKSVRGKS
jgi:hypothetical protein